MPWLGDNMVTMGAHINHIALIGPDIGCHGPKPKTLFGSKWRKKNKRFLVFNLIKGGVIFLTFLDPQPPTLTPVKIGSQVCVGGGSRPKAHWGILLLDKMRISHSVNSQL